MDLTTIKGLHTKLWALKIVGVPTLAISRLPRQNAILNVDLVERRRVYYKGEGASFPQVWVVVSLVNPSCLWFVLAPKVLQLCTNHLVLVLYRHL